MTISLPQLQKIELRRKSRVLHLAYDNDLSFDLDFEFLRVHSPSAEVKGHGPGQEVLQVEKQQVQITQLEAIGNYAVRLFFDDGHNSGIFSWVYLHELGQNQEQYWQAYLNKLQAANQQRLPASARETVVEMFDPNKKT